MKIWKYKVNVIGTGTADVMMPAGARLLSVGNQFGGEREGPEGSGLFVWALVDEIAPIVRRRLGVVLTGATIGDEVYAMQDEFAERTAAFLLGMTGQRQTAPYVGMVSMPLGFDPFVQHVFDLGEG